MAKAAVLKYWKRLRRLRNVSSQIDERKSKKFKLRQQKRGRLHLELVGLETYWIHSLHGDVVCYRKSY